MGDGTEARVARLLDQTLGYLLAALVFIMMLLTFVDVVGRQGFDAPVPALRFETWKLVGGKNSSPSSQTSAVSSASAVAVR